MEETGNIFAAVHWEPSEEGDYLLPEVLVVPASSVEQAHTLFNSYIKQYGLSWDSYDLEYHVGDGVVQLVLGLPEPTEDYDEEF